MLSLRSPELRLMALTSVGGACKPGYYHRSIFRSQSCRVTMTKGLVQAMGETPNGAGPHQEVQTMAQVEVAPRGPFKTREEQRHHC